MNKTKSRFAAGFALGIVAMAVVVCGIAGGLYLAKQDRKNSAVNQKTEYKMELLETLMRSYYLKDVDRQNIENGIYKGMLAGLGDPYSAYYTAEEYRTLTESNSGTYCGIGASVSQNSKTGVITVVSVFQNTPAQRAGLQSQDILFKVGNEAVTGMDLDTVVSKIKGDNDTEVQITICRDGQFQTISVQRDTITVPTIEYRMADEANKTGYIRISEFNEVTCGQFIAAVEDLKKQGMKSVIFDVRNNPGGLYKAVCDTLDYILPEGTLVYTEDKYGHQEKMTSDEKCLDMPIVVLQNQNSASASEIFSGAIQDFGAGTIVGETSFGKGIVQTIIPLSDGSAIKLTIQNYFTPNGKNIHGKGIAPDIQVEDNAQTQSDEVLEKAESLLNGNENKENKKNLQNNETGEKNRAQKNNENSKNNKSSQKKVRNSKKKK